MSNRIKIYCAAALFVIISSSPVSADIKVKSKTDVGGTQVESTTYIKGKRQRTEQSIGGIATLTQCDLRRRVQLNTLTKTYFITAFAQPDTAATKTSTDASTTTAHPSARKGGIITTTYQAIDTGERQPMFGFTARRIKLSITTASSPDACQQQRSRIESDGWYIDFAVDFSCEDEAAYGYVNVDRASGCRDEQRLKRTGAARLGYPVNVTTTIYDEDGKPATSLHQQTLEISKATLDANLFDIPQGYREVQDETQMYAAVANANRNIAESEASDDTTSSGMSLPRNNVKSSPVALGAKKAGTIRIGLVNTRVIATGEGVDSSVLGQAVTNTLASYLKAPAMETVVLEARIPAQAEAEAKSKECDFVIYSNVAHKRGKAGGFGGFLKSAAPVADAVGYGGYGGTGAAVAGAVATSAMRTAAEVAANVKAKDELTLEYAVQSVGAATPTMTSLKAKAKANGEDLITNLVEQAATNILSQTLKK